LNCSIAGRKLKKGGKPFGGLGKKITDYIGGIHKTVPLGLRKTTKKKFNTFKAVPQRCSRNLSGTAG